MPKGLFFLLILSILNGRDLIHAQDTLANKGDQKINRKTIYKAAAFTGIYYAGSIMILQNTWYKDREVVPFHFYNDNEGYLQVDKFGHCYGSYVFSYIGYHGLRSMNVSKNMALIFGGTLGIVLQTPIEIMDAVHEGWGFSWGDMIANVSGSLLVIGQELLFHEQLIRFKFSYWESSYSKMANGYLGETTLQRILEDYNGHTYWLSFPVNELIASSAVPSWLNIALGYGANGMYGEYDNISSYNGVYIPETERYRQYVLSLDVNWTKIRSDSRFVRGLFKGLNFIKVPFPTIEYNSKGNFVWYWLYM